MPSVSINGYLALGLRYSGGGFTEVVGSQYARKPVTLASQDGAILVNTAGTTFGPDVGADWGLVTWNGMYDAPSGGNLLLAWPQRLPRYAAASGTVTIPTGAIQLSLPRILATFQDSVVTNFPAGATVGAVVASNAAVFCGTGLVVGNSAVQANVSVAGGLQPGNNLADLANPSLARVNINQGDSALTFAAIIATDCNTGNVFHVTLTGNAQLGAPVNLRAGASYIWRIGQDSVGGRLLTFDPSFKFPSGTAPAMTTTPNATDILSALSDGLNVYATLMKDMR